MTEDFLEKILKRLDQLVIIQLANSGLSEKETAKILEISDKRVAKLVSGKYNQIRRRNE